MAALTDLSVYIHVPFCTLKCRYCDFYSITGGDSTLFERYVSRVLNQLEQNLEQLNPGFIATIFIGGGTPSLLSPELLNRFLERIGEVTGSVSEFSIEANPESLSTEFLEVLTSSPVDRVSMGVQTYNPALLSWLGRPAGSEAVAHADRQLEKLWQGRLNRDLLAALPTGDRNLSDDLKSALSDDPGHLSLYELTIEEGTPLASDSGALKMLPDGEESLDEWIQALEYIKNAGYERYEVSNFARPGQECLHNLRYWEMKPYLGIGPGAASTLPGPNGTALRREVKGNLSGWLEGQAGTVTETHLSTPELMTEHFMMGLRTSRGVSIDDFTEVFSCSPAEMIPLTLEKWGRDDSLLYDSSAIRPGNHGMDRLDTILKDIVLELDRLESKTSCNWPALTVNHGT